MALHIHRLLFSILPLLILLASSYAYIEVKSEPCGKLIIGADRTVQPILDKVIDNLFLPAETCKPRVIRDYGPTGVVWFKLSTSNMIDVYGTISGHSLRAALEGKLIDENTLVILGYSDLLIYVRENNPHGITGLRDLVLEKSGLVVAIPHPDYTAAGQIFKAICSEVIDETSGKSYWSLLHEKHTVVYVFTAPKAVAYVRIGSADVGVSFRTYYAVNPRGVTVVEFEKEYRLYVQPVAVAITSYSVNKDLAYKLIELISRDDVREEISRMGYITPDRLKEHAPYARVYGLEGWVN